MSRGPYERLSGKASPARSDQSIESLALAGAVAIRHIINERNRLRHKTYVQENELNSLRAKMADFRRQLLLIQGSHVKFAEILVRELREIDRAFQILLQNDASNQINREEVDLVSIAERFSPREKATGTQG